MKHTVVTALMLLLLSGCARKTEVVRVINWTSDSDSWKGRTRAQLVRIWGEPAKVKQVDDVEELIYFEYVPVLLTQTETPGGGSADVVSDPVTGEVYIVSSNDVPFPQREDVAEVKRTPLARFWVESSGAVVRYWLSTEVKSGCHTNPKPQCFGQW